MGKRCSLAHTHIKTSYAERLETKLAKIYTLTGQVDRGRQGYGMRGTKYWMRRGGGAGERERAQGKGEGAGKEGMSSRDQVSPLSNPTLQ